MKTELEKGLLRYKTGIAAAAVTEIYFSNKIIVIFDTKDEVVLNKDVIAFRNFITTCQAAESITLDGKLFIKQIFSCDREDLGQFFQETRSIYIRGCFVVDALEILMTLLAAEHVHIFKWNVHPAGRLGSLTNVGLPLTCDKFL